MKLLLKFLMCLVQTLKAFEDKRSKDKQSMSKREK